MLYLVEPGSEAPVSPFQSYVDVLDLVIGVSDSATMNLSTVGVLSSLVARVAATEYENPDGAAPFLASVIYELVENTFKYGGIGDRNARVRVRSNATHTVFVFSNSARHEDVQEIRGIVDGLQTESVKAMFIRRIEESSLTPTRKAHIGLLTVVKDYPADVRFRCLPSLSSPPLVQLDVELMLGKTSVREFI